jgi:hypothetical protein
MKKFLILFLFLFSSCLFAVDTDSLHTFWKHVDPVRVIITDLSIDRIGQFNASKIKIDEYTATDTTLIHEYMHYMIHKNNVFLSREDEEYVCCLVEAIYEFVHNGVEEKRYINSFTRKSMYYTKTMIEEYEKWLKEEKLID